MASNWGWRFRSTMWRKRASTALVLLHTGLLMCLMCTGKAQPRLHAVSLRWIAPTLQPLHLSTNATGTHAAVALGYGQVGWMNLDTGGIERTLSTGRYLPIVAVAQRGNLLMIADSGDLVSGDSVIDLWDTAT